MANKSLLNLKFELTNTENGGGLRMYFGGEGGNGKSRVIQAIIAMSHAWDRPNAIITNAHTGIAAVQVNGKTVHSFFKIQNIGRKSSNITDRERIEFSEIKFILWYEMSMTDKRQFSRALRRLRLLADTKDYTKCRINLVLFGDSFQLPPVHRSYLFEEPLPKFGRLKEKYTMKKKLRDTPFG